MIHKLLFLLGYKISIYIALFVFFLACFLGYASNLDFETLIQKSVIAGCAFGMTSFLIIKMLVGYVPENIVMENHKSINK
ncbi:MAG: hypothetical protein ACUBOA_10795 [Candidatus Loosdrechtia sp.]|uniref:hypothetical protein n=1 Tax=Candidatus Loosdrechtia sp. TaxID=3101272 RepID=UPI003A76FE52|nr:MAG: hypothetical protein QY305_11605 [Candidatus Jettenia sp. AMX2]